MTARRPVNKDDDFYRRVIHRSHQRFLEDLDPVSILDLFLETEYIPYTQVRDIQETRLSSDQIRAILRRVSSKGVKGYKRFKGLLLKSHQGHLAEYLDEQEVDLEKEIKMAERNPKAPSQNSAPVAQQTEYQRVPDDKELSSIAAHIGINWEMLGPFLGIPTATIDQIKLDNSTTLTKIYRMLYIWRAMNAPDATLEKLLSQMEKAPRAVNIDWDALREDIKRYNNRTSGAAAGAKPVTAVTGQEQLLIERITSDRLQQLSIEQPRGDGGIGHQGIQDPQTGTLSMVGRYNDDSYQANQQQQQQTLPSDNPSLAAMEGEFGNTRRQGEYQSNEFGPDMSGKSNFSMNRPDGPPETRVQAQTQGNRSQSSNEEDQIDAARRRSLEREYAVSVGKPYAGLAVTAGSSRSEQAVASGTSNTGQSTPNVSQKTGPTKVSFVPNQPGEVVKSSISTIETELGKVKEVLREKEGITFLPEPESIAQRQPRNTQTERDVHDFVDGSRKRDERIKAIFDSEHDMKGRLKVLTAENIEDLLDSSVHVPNLKGGFGDIYVSKDKVPGIDIHLVVKKVDLKEEESEQKMRSLTNEKLCARAMHFAIVPLLGIREDTENRIYYFLSPYMEKGNLNKAIEDDKNRLRGGENPVLHVSRRLKIMFQIASAIDFLHTPVKDIRGTILHMDIKSLNIVLDKDYNARLIDFGLAREMKEGFDHTKTASKYWATPGYGKLTKQEILIRHDDYRYFGVVIRELLTGNKPSVEGCPEEELIHQPKRKIRNNLMEMWSNLKARDTLVDLSTDCIEDTDFTSDRIVKTLKKVLLSTNTPRWENTGVKSEKCDMCLEYKAVKEEILTHSCGNKMNVCVSCMRNSYCNPIRCHSCDKPDSIDTIHPTIGHGWSALLVAGDDGRDSVASSFKGDVDAVHKVITSKCPLVMGVSVDRIQVVYPEDNMKEKIGKAVKSLQMVGSIQTVLIYFSGHYKPEEGGFELRSNTSNTEYLSITELQSHIANIFPRAQSVGESYSNTKRAIVFLDCCSAPAVTVSPVEEGSQSGDAKSGHTKELILQVPDIRIVQINACRPDQRAVLEPGGSLFRLFLCQGLTRTALDETCVNFQKCLNCHIDGDFVTAENLLDYISKHLENYKTSNRCDCVMNSYNAGRIDLKIGYAINFKVDLQFTYRFKGRVAHEKIPQRMFGELSELQTVLFDKFIGKMKLDQPKGDEPKLCTADFREILCIEVEKGPRKHQRDRLTSLERIMAAWNAKRDLVVALRTMPEICEGMVGVFLSSNQTVEDILDFLENKDCVMINKKDYATTCVINIGDNFEKVMDEAEKDERRKSPVHPLKTFYEDLLELEDAIKRLKRPGTLHFKEVHIVFPCTNVGGTRKHRSDFLCYQLKKD